MLGLGVVGSDFGGGVTGRVGADDIDVALEAVAIHLVEVDVVGRGGVIVRARRR